MVNKMNRYLRLNQLALDFKEVECIEWTRKEEEFSSDSEQYSLRFHLRSGKCFTRQVQENQFKEIKGKYKEILKEGEEQWE